MKNQILPIREKIGYGFGDAASSMFWKMFSMYMTFFYTDIFGIPAAAVGTMFLLTRIWDAANDPIMGIIADRTTSKWGKFRPYLLWIALPFAIIGVLTFTTPSLSVTGKIIYAYITYTLMMMVYTAINVPYSSLLGVITSNIKERTSLASYRFVFAFGGSILVLATAEPLSSKFSELASGSPNPQLGWQLSMVVYGILAIIFFLFTFSWTRERIKPVKSHTTSIRNDLKDLLENKQWFILLGAGISSLIFNSIRDGGAIYYFKYFIQDQQAFTIAAFKLTITYSTLYLVLGQAANIVGVLLAKPVSDKIGKRNTFLYAMIIATILSILFYFIDREAITIIFIMQFFISVCAGIIFPLLWSMYADISDYSELKTGRRATGLIFSSSSMSQKMGWTLGGAVTGWLLALYGFKANVIQSAEAQDGIRMMLSFFPAAGALLSAIFIYLYKLSDSYMKEVGEKLNIHRASTEK